MADKTKVEEKFIEDAITRYRVSKFLESELDRAGFSRVAIQRTPMVTRIAVEVTNPGRVIGKRGKSIQDLTEAIQREFKIDNPQISVVESTNQNLEPRLMAEEDLPLHRDGEENPRHPARVAARHHARRGAGRGNRRVRQDCSEGRQEQDVPRDGRLHPQGRRAGKAGGIRPTLPLTPSPAQSACL